ncbi:nucleotide disphospho-sugar-binding domain-containing protein [Micromonospora violae]|uniref:nucleotide disphospho-sugar-binding domain-containing protein n=1 Tax=Micromonospora violae TaxID=1278207 RepID=UPI0033DF068A
MRVLLIGVPGSGLFLPTIPLGWALRTAGHEVLVANNGAAVAAVTRAGLCAVDPCPDVDVFAEFMAASYLINMTAPGEARPRRGGLGLFGEEMAEGLLAIGRDYRPDLVVSTLEQGAGPLVAAALGVPHVEQSIRLAWAADDEVAAGHRRRIADYLEPTRRRLGIPAPPARHATIDPRPPSLGGVARPGQWPAQYVPYNEARTLPAWLLRPSGKPRVCVTLGTVLSAGGVDGVGALLAALARTGAEIVVTLEPGVLDAQDLPGNVRLAGWVPLHALLPSCAAIVHHGGAGTALTALAAGVPHLVLPHNADQPANAEVLVRRGVGVSLDPGAARPDDVEGALLRLLTDEATRAAADEVRAEIAAAPPLHTVVARLEALAA